MLLRQLSGKLAAPLLSKFLTSFCSSHLWPTPQINHSPLLYLKQLYLRSRGWVFSIRLVLLSGYQFNLFSLKLNNKILAWYGFGLGLNFSFQLFGCRWCDRVSRVWAVGSGVLRYELSRVPTFFQWLTLEGGVRVNRTIWPRTIAWVKGFYFCHINVLLSWEKCKK